MSNDEGEREKSIWSCMICIDSKWYPMTIVPCGHCVCQKCSKILFKCPKCRVKIEEYIPNREVGEMNNMEYHTVTEKDISELLTVNDDGGLIIFSINRYLVKDVVITYDDLKNFIRKSYEYSYSIYEYIPLLRKLHKFKKNRNLDKKHHYIISKYSDSYIKSYFNFHNHLRHVIYGFDITKYEWYVDDILILTYNSGIKNFYQSNFIEAYLWDKDNVELCFLKYQNGTFVPKLFSKYENYSSGFYILLTAEKQLKYESNWQPIIKKIRDMKVVHYIKECLII